MKQYLFHLLLFSILFSCNNNKFDVDVSNININLEVKRLDQDILKNYPDTPDVYELSTKYGTFLDLYGHQILGIGGTNEMDFAAKLHSYCKYTKDYRIPAKVEAKFGDFSKKKTELEQSLKYYKYYFPDKEIPVIYTYLSDFKQSIVIEENLIGIGLDKYLGAESDLYGIFEKYMVRRMRPEMVTVDFMRAMAISEFQYDDTNDNLLSQMVHEGKIQYFLDAVLPFAEDSLKFGYTDQQMDWANINEKNMWEYIVENKLLFSTDNLTIRGMIGEGPFTTLFANNSAPKAGVFLGWKIVHRYMEKKPEVTLPELMANNDYQKILNDAKYKP